jgi:hypothetical protein
MQIHTRASQVLYRSRAAREARRRSESRARRWSKTRFEDTYNRLNSI